MTFLTETTTLKRPSRITNLFRQLAQHMAEQRRQRLTDAMLAKLSDRQKADLGLNPGWHATADFDAWQA